MATISQTSHAIERALTAIRMVHPDVRPAIVVVYRRERVTAQDYHAMW